MCDYIQGTKRQPQKCLPRRGPKSNVDVTSREAREAQNFISKIEDTPVKEEGTCSEILNERRLPRTCTSVVEYTSPRRHSGTEGAKNANAGNRMDEFYCLAYGGDIEENYFAAVGGRKSERIPAHDQSNKRVFVIKHVSN